MRYENDACDKLCPNVTNLLFIFNITFLDGIAGGVKRLVKGKQGESLGWSTHRKCGCCHVITECLKPEHTEMEME